MIGFYVTARRGMRTAWLAGPFETHEAAVERLDEVRILAHSLDWTMHFDGFGTARIEAPRPPLGRLNHLIDLNDLRSFDRV